MVIVAVDVVNIVDVSAVVMVDGISVIVDDTSVDDMLVDRRGVIVDDDPVVIRVVSVDNDVATVVVMFISGFVGATVVDFIPNPSATALIMKLIRQIHIIRIHRRRRCLRSSLFPLLSS